MTCLTLDGSNLRCAGRAKYALIGVSLLALGLPSCPALAQTEADPQSQTDPQSQSSEVGAIIVTARRRSESLQDTPIAISAVTSEGLSQRGIDNVTQVGDFTPNVKFNSSTPISGTNASASIFIRGIGQNDYQLSADPGVGLYLDGVYISRGVGNVLDVLNVERIEILRGPQGTLFGRNTIGGAVSVITKKPGNQFTGNFEATTGSYDRVQIKGSIDLPVADGVYTSFSGFYHRRDGYLKGVVPGAPTLGDTDQLAGRFALRLEPTNNLTIDIAVDGSRVREQTAPVALIAANELAPAAAVWNGVYSGAAAICTDLNNPARLSDQRCYNSQWNLAPFQHAGTFNALPQAFKNANGRPFQSVSDLDIWGVSGVVDWAVADNLNVKSITAYRKVTGFWNRDTDHSPASITQTSSDWVQDQFSQELQISGNLFDDSVNWVAGAYFSDESGEHKDLVSIVDAVFLSGAVIKGKSYAAFGQATWEIVHDLNLTAGIRWTQDGKRFSNANQYVVDAGFLRGQPFNPDGSGLQDGDPLMGPLGQTASIKDRAWTPMVSLSYRWSPEIMTYASYSKGFKGGGFTQRVFPPLGFIPSFAPETSETFELGFKTNLIDRKVRLNGAAFLNNYGNLQVTVNDPSIGFAPIIQNAAQARIKGAELELEARPTDSLHLQAGLGYLDAAYRQVDIRALSSGVSVNTNLQNAPEWTLSASASYDFEIDGFGRITPRVDWSYRSKVYNDAINTPALVQPGYHLVNAAVAFNDSSEKLTITLGVKNLTDKVYLTSGYSDDFSGNIEGAFGRPREWYLSARYNF